MTTALTLTPVEAAAWQAVEPGGVFHLVRDGDKCSCPPSEGYGHVPFCPPCIYEPAPPVEFVQACAPCETCRDHHWVEVGTSDPGAVTPCPDCRIELVGQCLRCKGAGFLATDNGSFVQRSRCSCGGGRCKVTLGYGYALGEPLPIHDRRDRAQYNQLDPLGDGSVSVNPSTGIIMLRPRNGALENITAALAHYGDPAGLVGKWLLRITKAVS